MHAAGRGLPRKDVVDQVRAGSDPSLKDFARYVPIGQAPEKLRTWQRAGAAILYLTSRQTTQEVQMIRAVLRANGFPPGRVLFREGSEAYADVAARLWPDVIVEDDCESIGGEPEMTYPHLPLGLRRHVRSVVVPEFGGIDRLPDDPAHLTRSLGSLPGPV